MPKKKKKEEPDRWTLYLTYDESRTGGAVCEGQENDPWPSYEDEYTEFTLIRCNKESKNAAWAKESLETTFKPEVGSKVWVVVVRYSTGGTFGTTNGAWTILGIYEHLDEAKKVEASVHDNTYSGYKCWVGYFESLECVEIESMTVEA